MSTDVRRFRPLLLLPVLTIVLAAAHPAAHSLGVQEADARRAAQNWLALIDSGQYEQSWAEAARAFQRAVTAEAWARQAASARQRSGASISRELVSDTDVTDPPGVPPGEYFRIRYETECSTGLIRETVLLVRESGRGWRVVSYVVG